jgi:hypothetical protein
MLKTYEVVVSALITKKLTVVAENPQDAQDLAFQEFDSSSNGDAESYREDICSLVEIEASKENK